MKFTLSEMYPGYKKEEVPEDVLKNLETLVKKLNDLGKYYSKPVTVKRGYRAPDLNEKVGGVKNSPHMTGHAVDLVDKDGEIDRFMMNNSDKLKKLGLYVEDPQETIGWCHIQFRKASTIFFNP